MLVLWLINFCSMHALSFGSESTCLICQSEHVKLYTMLAFWFTGTLSFVEQNIDIFFVSYKISSVKSFPKQLPIFFTQDLKSCCPFLPKYGTLIQIVFLSSVGTGDLSLSELVFSLLVIGLQICFGNTFHYIKLAIRIN